MEKEEHKTGLQRILNNILSLRLILSLIIGGLAGYAYYYFIGCSSGSCAITSSPVNSVLYGIAIGGLLGYGNKKTEK